MSSDTLAQAETEVASPTTASDAERPTITPSSSLWSRRWVIGALAGVAGIAVGAGAATLAIDPVSSPEYQQVAADLADATKAAESASGQLANTEKALTVAMDNAARARAERDALQDKIAELEGR